ncbi:MMPL family transporter [Brevibacterium album]|uniref:MMPL family transporter n=1 Tax=Brevibacterium album TaxID=417948 RepID=UPI00040726EC|nr:efflux RND transporter permease subunit [Brevibacterium album]
MTSHRRAVPGWLRVLLPALLVLAWLIAAAVGGPYFGRVDEVSSNDRTAYLPSSAEATAVQERLADFSSGDALPAVVVFTAEDRALSEDDLAGIGDAVADAAALPVVQDGASPAIPSEDGRAAQAFVPLDASADAGEAVTVLSEQLTAEAPAGIEVRVTGPAGFSADLGAAFAGIDGLLLAVALSAVFLILLVVYRSVLLPFAVLGTSMFALCTALLAVWWLAKSGALLLSGQTQGILFILVIGAATDYGLLLTARAREAFAHEARAWDAVRTAVRGSLEPIVASGGTVIAGLLCLLLSDLKSNSALGPVAAIGIVFAMLSALTFLPSVLVLLGRAAFWPRVPHLAGEESRGGGEAGSGEAETGPTAEAENAAGRTDASARTGAPARAVAAPRAAAGAAAPAKAAAPEENTGLWERTARFVGRHARSVWIVTALVLVAGAAFVPQLRADGVPQSDLVLGASEAREGQERLAAHFPGGAGSPVQVLVDEERAAQTARVLARTAGVDSVAVSSADSPSGSLPLDAEGQVTEAGPSGGAAGPEGPGGAGDADDAAGPGGSGGPPPAPTVSEGQVLLQATLEDAADSASAEETVRTLRAALHADGGGALVGGVTATAIDTNDAAVHDRTLIIPVVLAVILLILMALLRSVLAPVLLIATTVLSFGTAMGVSALVFDHVLGFPGADPAVPLYGFVFLVALGIDYNIFLMTRVREETLAHGTRAGVLRGLVVTGGVITSAGIVLAATFAALAVIPILFLAQLAFIVAFGVLLDTFAVRTLLVPALVHDLGPRVWWPARPDGRRPTAEDPAGRRAQPS